MTKLKINISGQLWDFKEGKPLPHSDTNSVYADGFLYENLKIFAERLIHNFDSWINICGDEGDGKSLLAKQIAAIVGHILSSYGHKSKNHTTFTHTQFKAAVLGANKFDVVVYDEAISGLSARRAMSLINTALISMAAQCRKKNLFVIICLPSFHDLDKNIAIHRTRALLNVYTDKFSRGYFSYYTKDQKRRLYVDGKKYYDMTCVRPEFRGRYTHWSFEDEATYEQRKDQAALEQSAEEKATHRWMVQRNAAFYLLEQQGLTHAAIAEKVSSITGINLARNSVSDSIRALGDGDAHTLLSYGEGGELHTNKENEGQP